MTDVGRQRKHNEDHVLLRPELDLYVVADGMGGHNAGDVASRLTTTSLRNFYEATADGRELPQALVTTEEAAALERDALRLAAAVRKANRDVHEISQSFRQHHGMGSTVVGAAVDCAAARIHVSHVGDSRCYRVRDAGIEQLTRDHSLINDAIALKPDLTQEELARLPKNIITRALGMREDVKVDLRSDDIFPGDIYVLCSDGLSGMVSDEEILDLVVSARDLREAAESLVARANEAGGNDNITALLLRFETDDDGAAALPPSAAVSRGSDGLDGDSMVEAVQGASPDAARPATASGADARARASASNRPGAAGVEVTAVALCPKCGAELEPGNRFCTDCGLQVLP